MTPEGAVVLFGVIPGFIVGWIARDVYDHMLRGHQMARTRPVNALLDWFGHGRRLIGLSVVAAVLAISAGVYTFNADQQSEDRTDDVIACIADYVRATSEAQAPRTSASTAASDARRDWDRGFSTATEAAHLTKDELKVRYLEKYDHYVKVRVDNPLPALTRQFCEDAEDSRR